MMTSEQSSARFGSELSRVLYVDVEASGAIRPTAAEGALVASVCARIRAASDEGLHSMCFHIETRVMPLLSGESLLELARVIEAKAPWMIDNIPRLAAHKARLRRASEFAETFGEDNLGRLVQALKDEALRS